MYTVASAAAVNHTKEEEIVVVEEGCLTTVTLVGWCYRVK